MAAVVKANAYGCGLGNVVEILVKMQVSTFFVATWQEAFAVASHLKSEAKIYILSDDWGPTRIINDARLIAVASTVDAVSQLVDAGPRGPASTNWDTASTVEATAISLASFIIRVGPQSSDKI